MQAYARVAKLAMAAGALDDRLMGLQIQDFVVENGEGDNLEEEEEMLASHNDFGDGEIPEEIEDYGDEEDMMDEEVLFADDGSQQSESHNKFDLIVGKLEEVIMNPTFQEQQTAFCRENCKHFEETEENSLVCMDLFGKYQELMEKLIEDDLVKGVENFDMGEFMGMLSARQGELEGEVFDILYSLTEFDAFKELMLDYKREGEVGAGGGDLNLSGQHMHVYEEEQEDGEERPDLMLSISGIGPKF